jgi:hypothetical protein
MPKFLVTVNETINKEWQIEVVANTEKEAMLKVRTGEVDYLDGVEQDEESEIEVQYADELDEEEGA